MLPTATMRAASAVVSPLKPPGQGYGSRDPHPILTGRGGLRRSYVIRPWFLANPAPQANTLRPYLDCVRSTLDGGLCVRNFPSQTVERHNKPEVEIRGSKEVRRMESWELRGKLVWCWMLGWGFGWAVVRSVSISFMLTPSPHRTTRPASSHPSTPHTAPSQPNHNMPN